MLILQYFLLKVVGMVVVVRNTRAAYIWIPAVNSLRKSQLFILSKSLHRYAILGLAGYILLFGSVLFAASETSSPANTHHHATFHYGESTAACCAFSTAACCAL